VWLPAVLFGLDLEGGSFALRAPASRPVMHTLYIAADEVVWDYAPSGLDRVTGEPFGKEIGKETGAAGVGSPVVLAFTKALYREYTDSTFTAWKTRPPRWKHLGALGPLIRATVGDTIRIVFRNHASFPASMHAHGLSYGKEAEGASYADGTRAEEKSDDAVPPGNTHEYVWTVPARSGPGPEDPGSILWLYHSHVDEQRDVSSGLIGPILVSARGRTKADGTPKGVDREVVLVLAVVDEGRSWYRDENLARFAGTGSSPPVLDTMNGFAFGHLPGLEFRSGEHVRWYIAGAVGSGAHFLHWHGNTVLVGGRRTDLVEVLPLASVVADMVPDRSGTWLLHTRTGAREGSGTGGLYRVVPPAGRSQAPASEGNR